MSATRRRQVLVVEDNPNHRTLVRAALEPEFAVLEAPNGREGLRAFHQHRPDLVVLDAQMPELDGWEALRRIRDVADTPIIMLTGLGRDQDIVRGLQSGADEYVLKPISPTVLAARVSALLRRAALSPAEASTILKLDEGQLIIDRTAGRVWARGAEVQLSATEYRLLTCLAEHPGQVLSPSQILERVWGSAYAEEVGYVKTYIGLLRAKIEPEPSRPRYIVTRRGLGYMLVRGAGE